MNNFKFKPFDKIEVVMEMFYRDRIGIVDKDGKVRSGEVFYDIQFESVDNSDPLRPVKSFETVELPERVLERYDPKAFITVYFSEGALEYLMEGKMKDRFKHLLAGAMNPKYRSLTNEELLEIEGMQTTYGAESLGTPVNTIPIKLPYDIKISTHAKDQMIARNIPKENLQLYINNSMFMFNQEKERTRLYVSSNGSVVISVKNVPEGLVVTVYSVQDYYTDQLGPIVKEVERWLKITK